jgi:hypothetical protein
MLETLAQCAAPPASADASAAASGASFDLESCLRTISVDQASVDKLGTSSVNPSCPQPLRVCDSQSTIALYSVFCFRFQKENHFH